MQKFRNKPLHKRTFGILLVATLSTGTTALSAEKKSILQTNKIESGNILLNSVLKLCNIENPLREDIEKSLMVKFLYKYSFLTKNKEIALRGYDRFTSFKDRGSAFYVGVRPNPTYSISWGAQSRMQLIINLNTEASCITENAINASIIDNLKKSLATDGGGWLYTYSSSAGSTVTFGNLASGCAQNIDLVHSFPKSWRPPSDPIAEKSEKFDLSLPLKELLKKLARDGFSCKKNYNAFYLCSSSIVDNFGRHQELSIQYNGNDVQVVTISWIKRL